MKELPQFEGPADDPLDRRHANAGEQWSYASACSSGEHKPPRAEDELSEMRARWRAVLAQQGKLVPSAVRPVDVAPRHPRVGVDE